MCLYGEGGDGGAGDVGDDGVGRETASGENGNHAMLVRKRGKGVRVSSPQSIAFAGWKPAPLPGEDGNRAEG